MTPEQAEAETLKEESAMSKLVTQVISLDEALTALEAEEAEGRAYGRSEIERDTLQLRESMPNADIQIMDSYLDAPADVIAEMEKEGMTDTKGVMNPRTGEVYLFSDKITSASEANRTAVHEGTHVGLGIAFGDELDSLLLDLANKIPPQLQGMADEIVETYGLDLEVEDDKIEMAEELITHGAEKFPNLNVVKRFIAKIRALLRKMGFVEEWSDNDVIGLILEARGALQRRGRSLAGITLEEDVEVEETGEIFTIEQDAQELLTQNEKRREACERVRKCL
jgi:hypothetical protein